MDPADVRKLRMESWSPEEIRAFMATAFGAPSGAVCVRMTDGWEGKQVDIEINRAGVNR